MGLLFLADRNNHPWVERVVGRTVGHMSCQEDEENGFEEKVGNDTRSKADQKEYRGM